jgi:2-phosphosulfolactate phosphatase
MAANLEVLFSPAEFGALHQRDLSQTVCVVFDVLRATSSMMTAFNQGAAKIIPVMEIPEALKIREHEPNVLLAGERDGLRIRADQTGGTEFDLGNSPREFTRAAVAGKTIVMSTTNGTRALRSCASAQRTLIGTFLGMSALVQSIRRDPPKHLLVICAGTIEQAAYEDTLAAGALCDRLWNLFESAQVADSALMARLLFRQAAHDLPGALAMARNGRRLLGNPDLRDDLAFCARLDVVNFTAEMSLAGIVQPVAHV